LRPIEEQQQVYQNMLTLRECLNKVPALREALDDPTATIEQKAELLSTASGPVNAPLYSSFVQLVLDNRRANQLIWIAPIYIDMYRQAQGIISVTVESAAPLVEDTRSLLEKQLAEMLGKQVECSYHEDEELIGGFRLRIGDKRIDASYKRRFEDLREAILADH